MPLPEGWKWDDDWQIDLNRAVDEEGQFMLLQNTDTETPGFHVFLDPETFVVNF